MGASTPKPPAPDYGALATDYRQWTTDALTRRDESLTDLEKRTSGLRAQLGASGIRAGSASFDTAMKESETEASGIEQTYQTELEDLKKGPTYETLFGYYEKATRMRGGYTRENVLGPTATDPDWVYGHKIPRKQESSDEEASEVPDFDTWLKTMGTAPPGTAGEEGEATAKKPPSAELTVGGAFDDELPGMQGVI